MSPLAHHSTELVGGGGNWNWEIAMVAGPGLSTGQGEAKALQEAGEEEEELHAGQGLPQASSAACRCERGSVSLGTDGCSAFQGTLGRDMETGIPQDLLRMA